MNILDAFSTLEKDATGIVDASIRVIEGLNAASLDDSVQPDEVAPTLSEELGRFEARLRELMPGASEDVIHGITSGHLIGLFAGRGVEIDVVPVPTPEPPPSA